MKKYSLLMVLISLVLGACIQPIAPPTPWPTMDPVLFEPNGLPTPPIPTPRPTFPPPSNDSDEPYVKPTEHYPTDVTWNQTHDFLYLQGGLTQAGRIQLERGQNSCFLIQFSQAIDEMLIAQIKDLGMEGIYGEIQMGDIEFVTRITPKALPFLEEMEAKGLLNFAGPYPPRFKIRETFEEMLAVFPPDEEILISIRLRDYPTDVEYAEVVHLIEVTHDTKDSFKTKEEMEAFRKKYNLSFSFYEISGFIQVQNIPIILNIPIVESVGPAGNVIVEPGVGIKILKKSDYELKLKEIEEKKKKRQ